MKRLLIILALLPMMAVESYAQNLKGDVNTDGTVDISDVVNVVNIVLNGTEEYTFCPDNHHPHLIDLGLPSGTKWSCCNVDASAPEATGGYYAFGETETKAVYIDGTYQFNNQPLSFLASMGLDVAKAKWGGSWMMPSSIDFEELYNHCSFQYVKMNNVYGSLITGPNGKSIFLPAAGAMYVYNLYSLNEMGYYWSGTPQSNNSFAYCLYFGNDNLNSLGFQRYFGFQVRPVQHTNYSLSLSEGQLSMTEGSTTTMTIYVDGVKEYENGKDNLLVQSSDESVATTTVNDSQQLVITACGEGTATINVFDELTGRSCQQIVTVTAASSSPSSLQLSATQVGLHLGSTAIVDILSGSGNYSLTNPSSSAINANLEGSTITINALNEQDVNLTVTDNVTGLSNTIEVSVLMPFYKTCPDDHHPHAIDPGLPSGTKWACCNVGALNPYHKGYYFAWGETWPKNSYTISNYVYYDQNNNTYTVLNGPLGNGIISFDKRYDPATSYWGNYWGMPSHEEFSELIQNCKNYNWYLVRGIGIESYSYLRMEFNNGAILFLPCAGRFDGNEIKDHDDAYYWSGVTYFYEDGNNVTFVDGTAFPMHYNHNLNDFFTLSINAACSEGLSIRPIYRYK